MTYRQNDELWHWPLRMTCFISGAAPTPAIFSLVRVYPQRYCAPKTLERVPHYSGAGHLVWFRRV